jgi:hypothetical protein
MASGSYVGYCWWCRRMVRRPYVRWLVDGSLRHTARTRIARSSEGSSRVPCGNRVINDMDPRTLQILDRIGMGLENPGPSPLDVLLDAVPRNLSWDVDLWLTYLVNGPAEARRASSTALWSHGIRCYLTADGQFYKVTYGDISWQTRQITACEPPARVRGRFLHNAHHPVRSTG